VSLAILIGTGCSTTEQDGKVVTVFAASSLSTAFVQIEKDYEVANEGVDVRISFGSSDQLAAQIEDGAEVDLIATADRVTAERVASDKLAIKRIAGNSLAIMTERTIATPKSLAELQMSGLTVVIGAPDTPIGRYTASALAAAGVRLEPKSLEPNSKAVISKVRLGEVDAAIVYASDARTAGDQFAYVAIPSSGENIELDAVALRPQGNDLLEFVLSDTGQQILRTNGFDK
jgi:molybdate transport system substrate-binding protein